MSEYSQFNMTAYKMVQIYLRTMLETGIKAGRSLANFTAFMSAKHGDDLSPYIQQFLKDVSAGRIKIEGLERPVGIVSTKSSGIRRQHRADSKPEMSKPHISSMCSALPHGPS